MTTNITDEQKQEIQKMNQELDIYVPGDVELGSSTEDQWLELLYYLRRMYFVNHAVEKEEIQDHFRKFYQMDFDEKNNYLGYLDNYSTKVIDEKRTLDALYGDEILARKMELAFKALPDEKKPGFLYFIDTGKNPDENTDLSQYEAEIFESQIDPNQRIASALDKRNLLDARQFGQTMSPEQVDQFLEQNQNKEAFENPNMEPQPNQNQAQSQGQPNIQQMQPSPQQVQMQNPRQAAQPVQRPANPRPNQPQPNQNTNQGNYNPYRR